MTGDYLFMEEHISQGDLKFVAFRLISFHSPAGIAHS